MATLKLAIPGKGTKVYRIHKKITSLGRSDEADVIIADPELADSHVHIHFDGREFNLATTEKDAEVFVNGKKKSRHKLQHEDRIRIGAAEMEFSLYDQPVADEGTDDKASELASYKQLYEFSHKLMASYELPALLDQLMDVMIAVSSADKGFLVLMESGEPVVKVARNIRRETISDAVRQLSDSIIEHVVKTAQADHHLRRAQRRGVQELAVGRESEIDVGDVRAAARTRQHHRRHLRRQRPRRPAVRPVAPGDPDGVRRAGLAAGAQRAAGQRAASSTTDRCTTGSSRSASARSSARRRACRRSSASCRRSRRPTSPCSSPARPAPARS